MSISRWIGIGALLLFVAVAAGAFGAHGLKHRLDAYALSVYEKAVFYQFVHALGLILVSLLVPLQIISPAVHGRIAALLVAGMTLFCGSLYALALTGFRWLGAVTPLGGSAFLIAWVLLAWTTLRR